MTINIDGFNDISRFKRDKYMVPYMNFEKQS